MPSSFVIGRGNRRRGHGDRAAVFSCFSPGPVLNTRVRWGESCRDETHVGGLRFCAVFLLVLLTLGQVNATAGEPLPKMHRMGSLPLLPDPAGPLPLREAFLRGLRDFGWAEGQNVVVEFRSAGGKSERLPALAAELIGLNVEVIIVSGEQAIDAAKRATQTVPIVAISSDPVGTGVVPPTHATRRQCNRVEQSRPGLDGEAPTIARHRRSEGSPVWPSSGERGDRAQALQWREMTVAAKTLGIRLHSVEVQEANDFSRALGALSDIPAEALITFTDPLTIAHRADLVDFARRRRLPTMLRSGLSWTLVGSWPMGRAFPTCSTERHLMWTDSSRAPGRASFRWSGPPSLSW